VVALSSMRPWTEKIYSIPPEQIIGREGLRLALIVHHTDTDREWAYDRKSHIGNLDKALDEANANGWTVVDMKKDWKRIFPWEK
jgi:hypothetical protein